MIESCGDMAKNGWFCIGLDRLTKSASVLGEIVDMCHDIEVVRATNDGREISWSHVIESSQEAYDERCALDGLTPLEVVLLADGESGDGFYEMDARPTWYALA